MYENIQEVIIIEWLEVKPLPEECVNCQEDCYDCDTAGKGWTLSRVDELRTKRRLIVRVIKRLQQQIDSIDKELLPFSARQRAALDGTSKMTYDLFWECLQVCFDGRNMDMYMSIWNAYPNHVNTVKSTRPPK